MLALDRRTLRNNFYCRLVKKVADARRALIGRAGRRTHAVRRSEANKRNEADGLFSAACSFHTIFCKHFVNKTALIELLQYPIVDELFRLNFFNLRIASLH